MKFLKFENKEKASQFAANLLIQEIKKNQNINLGLATGSTPVILYNMLVEDYNKNNTDWSNITTFNLDEYLGLDPLHPQSYHYFMQEKLFNKVNINLDKTHFPGPGFNYDQEILTHGGIDIQILGIGTNGHIGFNEPGSELNSKTRIVDLTPKTIEVNADLFFKGNQEEVPKQAYSMGIDSILKAKKIILLAFGESKSETINNLKNAQVFNINNPASALLLHNDVTILIDEEVDVDL